MINLQHKSISTTLVALILLSYLLGLAACGYRFSGGGELPGNIHKVYISIFENKSGETGIEMLLSNYLVNQFTRFKTVKIVKRDEAEAILTGTIKGTHIRAIAHETPNQPAEESITLYIDVEMTSPDGRLLWSANDIAATDTYDVAPEKIRTEQNKRSAIAILSERAAERIYYRLTDQF